MIAGKKIVLKAIEENNIEWMRKQRNLPEMRKYYREWKEISKDQQRWWYTDRGNNMNQNHVYFEIHALNKNDYCKESKYYVRGADESLIGCTGLHYVDWRLRSAEFGVFIAKDVKGKGLGVDALRTLFDYGFKEMNLHKIWAEVYNNNIALDVYTKGLGMKEDGVLRDSYFCDGKYGNSTMLSVLENEWGKL